MCHDLFDVRKDLQTFQPMTLSSKNSFIQKQFLPMTLSSKINFTKKNAKAGRVSTQKGTEGQTRSALRADDPPRKIHDKTLTSHTLHQPSLPPALFSGHHVPRFVRRREAEGPSDLPVESLHSFSPPIQTSHHLQGPSRVFSRCFSLMIKNFFSSP